MLRQNTGQFMIFRAWCMLLVVTTSAHADASFDCRKAVTPVELAICADPATADLDGKVHTAYKAARQRLATEPKQLAELAASQRSFIAMRNSSFGQPGFSLAGHLSKRLAELQQPRSTKPADARVDIRTYFQLVPTTVFDDTTDGLEPEQRDMILRKGKNEEWILKRVHAGKAVLTAIHPTSIVTMTVMDFGAKVLEVHVQNEKNLTISYWIFRAEGQPLERYHPRLALRAAAAARHFTGRADASPGPVNPLSGVPTEIVAHMDALDDCRSSVGQDPQAAQTSGERKNLDCKNLEAIGAGLRRKYAADSFAGLVLDQAGVSSRE